LLLQRKPVMILKSIHLELGLAVLNT